MIIPSTIIGKILLLELNGLSGMISIDVVSKGSSFASLNKENIDLS
jgi:hypothetical protein